MSLLRFAMFRHLNACVSDIRHGMSKYTHVLNSDGVIVVGHDVAHLHRVVLNGSSNVSVPLGMGTA